MHVRRYRERSSLATEEIANHSGKDGNEGNRSEDKEVDRVRS